jgi:hypothetical protein
MASSAPAAAGTPPRGGPSPPRAPPHQKRLTTGERADGIEAGRRAERRELPGGRAALVSPLVTDGSRRTRRLTRISAERSRRACPPLNGAPARLRARPGGARESSVDGETPSSNPAPASECARLRRVRIRVRRCAHGHRTRTRRARREVDRRESPGPLRRPQRGRRAGSLRGRLDGQVHAEGPQGADSARIAGLTSGGGGTADRRSRASAWPRPCRTAASSPVMSRFWRGEGPGGLNPSR